jgi:hypothetical protein
MPQIPPVACLAVVAETIVAANRRRNKRSCNVTVGCGKHLKLLLKYERHDGGD